MKPEEYPLQESCELAFCSSCSNRAYQLKQTFSQNTEAISQCPEARWIIVNFGSRDDLDEWMLSKLERVSRNVVYVRVESPVSWHLSAAKNLSHRIIPSKILANIDCDNYLGNSCAVISRAFASGCRLLGFGSGVNRDGSAGRIAAARDLFEELGGYDEDLLPMGYQDVDLLNRARAAGVPVIRIPSQHPPPVQNTKVESIQHCRVDGLSWEQMNQRNEAQSRANIASHRLKANLSRQPVRYALSIFRGHLS